MEPKVTFRDQTTTSWNVDPDSLTLPWATGPLDVDANSLSGDISSPEAQAAACNSLPTYLSDATIAIVDDQATNVKVLQEYLRLNGYLKFVTTTDSSSALSLLQDNRPEVLLLDIKMPGVDGLEILSRVRQSKSLATLPVLMLTASDDHHLRLLSLELGATDLLSKPVDQRELMPRVRNALTLKLYHDQLSQYAERLEVLVRERTAMLETAQREALC